MHSPISALASPLPSLPLLGGSAAHPGWWWCHFCGLPAWSRLLTLSPSCKLHTLPITPCSALSGDTPVALNRVALRGAAPASRHIHPHSRKMLRVPRPHHAPPQGVFCPPLGALAPGQSSFPPLSTAPCVRLVCSLSIPPSLPGAAPRVCTQARSEGEQLGLAVSRAHGPRGDGHGGTALPGQALGFLPWPERACICEPETPGPVSRGLSAGRCSRHPTPGPGSHTTPREHAVLGPRTCSGGRQSRQERGHISLCPGLRYWKLPSLKPQSHKRILANTGNVAPPQGRVAVLRRRRYLPYQI